MESSLKSLLKMFNSKLDSNNELHHILWKNLLYYVLRQGMYKYLLKTYTKYLDHYIIIDDNLYSVDTPYGNLYFPCTLKKPEIEMLFRESLDKKHWHQYDTEFTPITKDDVVLDCGCAEALWALSIVKKVKRLHLIEPQAAFHKGLELTFSDCKHKVEILQCAVGNYDGFCDFNQCKEPSISGNAKISKNGNTAIYKIDTLFRNVKISFIKADLEGFELEALQGAQRIIIENNPKIAITVYHQENDWREIKDFVLSLVPEYQWKLKGMVAWGKPLMLHMWVDQEK